MDCNVSVSVKQFHPSTRKLTHSTAQQRLIDKTDFLKKDTGFSHIFLMRNASSILLLANGPAKGFLSGPATVGAATNACAESAIRVLMIKRHTKARFMANMYVFPGGVLEETDGNVTKESLDPFRLGAVRELWEETSVSVGDDGAIAGRAPAPLYGIAPSLTPFAHWVTPVSERYRYDTWFFAHKAPNDAEALDLAMAQCPREVADVRWVSPQEGIEMNKSYESTGFCLSPPTWCLLDWLGKFPTSEAFIDHCRKLYRLPPPPPLAATNTSTGPLFSGFSDNDSSAANAVSYPPSSSCDGPSSYSTDTELIAGVIPNVLTSYREYEDGTSSCHIPSGMVHLPDGEYPHLIYGDCMVYVGDSYEPRYLSETSSGLRAPKEGMRTRR